MKVWLITIGEPLPLKPGVRKMRTGLLAEALAAQGHEVRWWVSAFEHQRKVMLFDTDQEVPLASGLTLEVLRGCGYSGNISLARYLDHRLVAGKFRSRAMKLAPPDIMVASMPCHLLAFEAVRYARLKNVPVLVDVRDLWPDIFLTRTRNPIIKKIGRLALSSDFRRLQQLLREASGLVAVSRGYLDWALEKAGRPSGKWDRVFFLGYQSHSGAARIPAPQKSLAWLKGHEGKKLILFVGTFGFSYELSLVVEAARRLQSAGRQDVGFILAGTGEQEARLRQEGAGLTNLLIPGWLGAEEIATLLRLGYLGLLPYTKTAPQSFPNKPFEYLSAGLPLVSSLAGEMAELVKDFGLGLNYRAGDPDDLCRALNALLDDPSPRNQMSANARAFFKEYGDADKIYPDYIKHMVSLAEAGKTVIPQGVDLKSCRMGLET
jgi:glycosyltransferase involved in cell wall biosynthesis